MELLCYDFNRICRACRNESADMRSLFDDEARFDEMLMACTSIQIDVDDGLPSLLCKICINQLLVAYHFKQQCELTDSMLRTYANINSMKINERNGSRYDCVQIKRETESETKEEENFNTSLLDDSHWLNNGLRESIGTKRELDNDVMACPTCSKIFTTLDGLKCHQRIHTGNMFQCKLCDKKYTRMNHLHRHELSHDPPKMHICKICNKGLTRYEHLKRHLLTHVKEKPYICQGCSRGFTRWEHLSKHMQCCKGSPVYNCDICNKNFTREESLILHLKVHEGKEKPQLPTIASLDEVIDHYIETEFDEDNAETGNNGDIDIDDLEFLEPQVHIEEKDSFENENKFCERLNELEMNVKNENPPKRGRGRPRKDPSTSPIKKTEGNFYCQICGKVFNDIRLFERHEKLHERLRTYQCTVCDKEFSRSYHLKRHMSSHLLQKIITCQFCKRNFSKEKYLFQHLKVHLEENLDELKCLTCQRTFDSLNSFHEHKCTDN